MTDEKELEMFFWEIFRNMWHESGIRLKDRCVTASTQTMITKYKEPILKQMLHYMRLHKKKSNKFVTEYFKIQLSAVGYDQFSEIVVSFLDEYLENSKNIFDKIVNSFSMMCLLGVHLHYERFHDGLQRTVSVYTKYFIDKLKDKFYENDAWNKTRTDTETKEFLENFYDVLGLSEAKEGVQQVRCEERAVSKPLSSSDETEKDKQKTNKHVPIKPIPIISDGSDLSDLSDYEIIGREVFPVKKNSKNCSQKNQVRKILEESFTQQSEELSNKIIQSNVRKNSKQNSFLANMSLSFKMSEDIADQRGVPCRYRLNVNNQGKGTHKTCTFSNIKTHIVHSKDVKGGRQTEDHKVLSSQTGKKFSCSKYNTKADTEKSIKGNKLQSKITVLDPLSNPRCHEETHSGGNIKEDNISFRNLNKTLGAIESKTKNGKLVSKSKSTKRTNFPRVLLKSKAANANSHKTAKPSFESHALRYVKSSLNTRHINASNTVKNNSNNCKKNETQSSAASSNNQANKVNVKYKEENEEYFDQKKENDLKLCSKTRSKRDRRKKKKRYFKK